MKKVLRRRVLSLVLGLSMPISLASCDDIACELFGSCTPSEAVVQLAVPLRPQQTQVWCWAATSEMVLAYYQLNVPQCQVLSAWMGTNCCFPNPFCAQGAPNLQVIQATLSAFGGLRSTLAGPLTFDQIKSEIDAGRPMIMAYRGSFAGHVVVIYGYDPKKNYVMIHDPYYGTFAVPYGRTFAYGGSMIWEATITGIQR